MRAPDVVIVGGGLAGLSAGVELTRRGARVVVLEARPGLGGRATAFVDPETGEAVDNGQHVLVGCYTETFRFLETIGTAGLVDLDESLDIEFVDRAGEHSRLRNARLPPPWHLVGGLLRWRALSWRDRVAAMRLGRVLVRMAKHGVEADGPSPHAETVAQWLRRHGQTDRITEMLWEPLAVAALNQPAETAAAAPFLTVLSRMFGGSRRDAAIGLPRAPLDVLYARPAAELITAQGGEVRTNAPARIACDGVRLPHVEVRGERIGAGAVICAVPWHALGRTVCSAPAALERTLRDADAMASSPIVTVNLWLDRAVTRVPFVGLPGRTLQWVFDKRQAFGGSASHLSLVSSGAAAIVGESNAVLIELALSEIRQALPLARDARVLRANVVREKRATFSLAPGQPARPPVETAVEGLFLAGDWIDTGLPATIESAVVSGHRAADAATSAS